MPRKALDNGLGRHSLFGRPTLRSAGVARWPRMPAQRPHCQGHRGINAGWRIPNPRQLANHTGDGARRHSPRLRPYALIHSARSCDNASSESRSPWTPCMASGDDEMGYPDAMNGVHTTGHPRYSSCQDRRGVEGSFHLLAIKNAHAAVSAAVMGISFCGAVCAPALCRRGNAGLIGVRVMAHPRHGSGRPRVQTRKRCSRRRRIWPCRRRWPRRPPRRRCRSRFPAPRPIRQCARNRAPGR